MLGCAKELLFQMIKLESRIALQLLCLAAGLQNTM